MLQSTNRSHHKSHAIITAKPIATNNFTALMSVRFGFLFRGRFVSSDWVIIMCCARARVRINYPRPVFILSIDHTLLYATRHKNDGAFSWFLMNRMFSGTELGAQLSSGKEVFFLFVFCSFFFFGYSSDICLHRVSTRN